MQSSSASAWLFELSALAECHGMRSPDHPAFLQTEIQHAQQRAEAESEAQAAAAD